MKELQQVSFLIFLFAFFLFPQESFGFVDPTFFKENNGSVIAQTVQGSIEGVVFPDSLGFLGVPYATPPVGYLRWQPPQEAQSWKPEVLNTQQMKPGCPQKCDLPPLGCPLEQSEDCLYFNLWAPLGSCSSLRPVLVFFPGGHFEQGAISSVLYTARYFVNTTGVILIVSGYRLGALGWLRTDDGLTGHYGLQDQRLLLHWVQENIQYFGGDPTQVTLWGQSAGATSTATHLISPLSKGLFSKAILESHPWTLQLKDASEAEDIGKKFAEDIGCSSASNVTACMIEKSVEEVLDAQKAAVQKLNLLYPIRSFYPFTPVVDGSAEVPAQPLAAISSGDFSQVPILMGTVANESNIFIYQGFPNVVDELEYIGLLFDVFKDHAPEVIKLYPPHMYSTNDTRLSLALMITHWVFTCPTRYIARQTSKYVPTYTYWFNHVWSFAVNGWGPNYTFCFDVVCHGSELPFVFHAAEFTSTFEFTSEEETLANSMVKYWANFGISSSPNFPVQASIQWPPYNATGDGNMNFGLPDSSQTGLDASWCDFWDTIGYSSWS